ncbi:MAG TPA: hypothetical protein VEQ58_23390 [Polyangiaceae bacterium]|nr:hypothetical protein [Polyangiaceae bacterium]
MSPLLAPLFAQLVSLQLGDRTEGRYTVYNGDKRYEASSAPVVALVVSSRKTNFQLVYSPSLVMSPVERAPRELYVFHQIGASVGYTLKRTTITAGSTFAIGSMNLKLIGLQGLQTPIATGAPAVPSPNAPTNGTPTTPDTPTTGTGTPTNGMQQPGTTTGNPLTQQPAIDQKVKFYVSTNTLGVTQLLTKNLRLGVIGSSSIANGMNDASRRVYPELRGWSLGANTGYLYLLSRQDSFNGTASFIKTWSSLDNEAAALNLSVTWTHRFGPMTSGSAGTGFSVTRFSQQDGLAGFSVFPTFTVGATHRVPVGRGGLAFSIAAYSNPALDPLRALIDPRIGMNANIVYSRKKLTLSTSGGVAFSLAPEATKGTSVNSLQAEARASYAIATVATVDTGARISRQTYGTEDVIPTSWAAFVGVTLGYRKILAGGR